LPQLRIPGKRLDIIQKGRKVNGTFFCSGDRVEKYSLKASLDPPGLSFNHSRPQIFLKKGINAFLKPFKMVNYLAV